MVVVAKKSRSSRPRRRRLAASGEGGRFMIVAAAESQVRSVWHLVQFLPLAGPSLPQAKVVAS